MYTVIHVLVVDVACVLFWTQSVCMCMVLHQNTRNIYHKQMNNGVSQREREVDFTVQMGHPVCKVDPVVK